MFPVSLVNTEGLIENVTSVANTGVETTIELLTAGILDILDLNFYEGGTANFMTQYFSFLDEVYYISQIIGFTILFIVVAFSLFKGLTGGLADVENPWILLIRALACCGAIGVAHVIMTIIYKPGAMLLDEVRGLFEETKTSAVSTIFDQAITATDEGKKWLGDLIKRIVLNIILIVFNVVIYYNYIKLALEALERWVVLAVLYYTSPIAFSMGASQNTVNVFKAWVRMVISSIVMLALNMAFIYIYLVAMSDLEATGTKLKNVGTEQYGVLAGPLLFCWVLLAILMTGQKLDQYCASLGMTTAQVGTRLGGEFMMAALGVGRAFKNATGTIRSGVKGIRQHSKERNARREAEEAAKTKAATAETMRVAALKKEGKNADGSQIVTNTGLKPKPNEMRNAFTGKGEAFTGEGNATALKDYLDDAKDAKGANPFEGKEILPESVTGVGCISMKMMDEDGSVSCCTLHEQKPADSDAEKITTASGDTLWMTKSAAAGADAPDYKTGKEFFDAMAIRDNAARYDDEGNVITSPEDASRDAITYNKDGVAQADSVINNIAAENGGIVNSGEATSDLAGNVAIQLANGKVLDMIPANNVTSSIVTESANFTPHTGTRCVDGNGREWIAVTHGPSMSNAFKIPTSAGRTGKVELSDTSRENIGAFLNIPPAVIGKQATIAHGGSSITVSATDAKGATNHFTIADGNVCIPNETVARSTSGKADRGYYRPDEAHRQRIEESGVAMPSDNTLVFHSPDRKEAEAAVTPYYGNTQLNAAGIERYNKENVERGRAVASEVAFSSEGGGPQQNSKLFWADIDKQAPLSQFNQNSAITYQNFSNLGREALDGKRISINTDIRELPVENGTTERIRKEHNIVRNKRKNYEESPEKGKKKQKTDSFYAETLRKNK